MTPLRKRVEAEALVQIGGTAPPISQQLIGKAPLQVLRAFDQDADQISRLYTRGILTTGDVDAARLRLRVRVARAIKIARET